MPRNGGIAGAGAENERAGAIDVDDFRDAGELCPQAGQAGLGAQQLLPGGFYCRTRLFGRHGVGQHLHIGLLEGCPALLGLADQGLIFIDFGVQEGLGAFQIVALVADIGVHENRQERLGDIQTLFGIAIGIGKLKQVFCVERLDRDILLKLFHLLGHFGAAQAGCARIGEMHHLFKIGARQQRVQHHGNLLLRIGGHGQALEQRRHHGVGIDIDHGNCLELVGNERDPQPADQANSPGNSHAHPAIVPGAGQIRPKADFPRLHSDLAQCGVGIATHCNISTEAILPLNLCVYQTC